MSEDSVRNKLVLPLAPALTNYIKHEYLDIGPAIISTVELAIKDSKNHYHDVMRSLEPLLNDKTKGLVDKLFMFRRKLCREGSRCVSQHCLFAHDEDELAPQKRVTFDLNPSKKCKAENSEVIFNRVDENKYTIDQLNDYASKFGVVNGIRRLNRGKYLVAFETPEEAKALVESNDFVLGDSEIKKFFNATVPTEQLKKTDIEQMLQEQKELIDRLQIRFDKDQLSSLKCVTTKIRKHILSNEKKSTAVPLAPQRHKVSHSDVDIESSIYYNMFAE